MVLPSSLYWRIHGEDWVGPRMIRKCLTVSARVDADLRDSVLTRYIAPILLEAGFVVVTYNARGVGQSQGWSSWMGRSEGEDAAAVIHWTLQRMGLEKDDQAFLLCCVSADLMFE